MRRRTMLLPMRPSPMTPICMALPRDLRQRTLDGGAERPEAIFQIPLEMDPQHTPPALGQHIEIAACLRCLDHAEACAMIRNCQVRLVVSGNLEKDATVGAPFVGLPRRMQESRTEFQAGCDAMFFPNG